MVIPATLKIERNREVIKIPMAEFSLLDKLDFKGIIQRSEPLFKFISLDQDLNVQCLKSQTSL